MLIIKLWEGLFRQLLGEFLVGCLFLARFKYVHLKKKQKLTFDHQEGPDTVSVTSTYIESLNPHNNPMRQVLLSPVYRNENRSPKAKQFTLNFKAGGKWQSQGLNPVLCCHSFHHTSQLPLTENWVMGQRTNETPPSWAYSKQEQDHTQLLLPQIPQYLALSKSLICLFDLSWYELDPLWREYLSKDTNEEESVVSTLRKNITSTGNSKYKDPEVGSCLVVSEEQPGSSKWLARRGREGNRKKLILQRKPGVRSFSATATHFKRDKAPITPDQQIMLLHRRKEARLSC